MQKFCLVLSFSFILASCSRLDFAFNWADTYITSKVDDYFDISFQQSRDLKKSLNADLTIIKKQILPKLISSAKKLRTDVTENRLTKESIDSAFSSTFDFFQKMPSYFFNTSIAFIHSLNRKQFRYFSKAFNKKLIEDSEKLRDQKEYATEMCEKYFKYFEMFLGDLTANQKVLIQKHVALASKTAGLKIKNKRWLFEKYINENPNSESLTNYVADFAANPKQFNMPEYEKAYTAYYSSLQKLINDILLSANPSQMERLKANLNEKIDQLERIVQSNS